MVDWGVADSGQLDGLLRFLRREEWGCVAFSARLLRNRQPRLPSRLQEPIYLHPNGDGAISSALLQTLFGLHLPVFADDIRPHELYLLARTLAKRRFYFYRLHSVMGRRRSADMLRALIRRQVGTTLRYWIMTLEQPPQRHIYSELSVRPACAEDLPQLMPLHERYLHEEVLLDSRTYDRAATVSLLRQALRTQVLYVAEWQGHIIGKAGTNARGMLYDQIGGVFTDENHRNRGVAAALMQGLADDIMVDGRKMCLFVKKDNAAALALYRKIGFEIRDEFEISYW